MRVGFLKRALGMSCFCFQKDNGYTISDNNVTMLSFGLWSLILGTIVVGGTFCDLLSCVLRMSTKFKSTWPVLSQFEKHAMAQSSLNPRWQTPKVNLFHIKF